MKFKFLPLLAGAMIGSAALHAQCNTNMVSDPNGTNGGTGWTLINNGDNGITTTTDNGTDCYLFSYAWDEMNQTIDLQNTFSSSDLTTQPNITFSEQFKTFSGASCSTAGYNITVSLLDGSSNVLQSWTTGNQNTSSNSAWETIEHSFVSYGGTPRYVTIVNKGIDCNNNTASNQGTEFTAITLKAVVPTSTTGSVVGDQNVNTVKSYDDPSSCTQTGVVLSTGSGSNLGSTTVVSTLDNTVQTYNNQPYVPRHYEIEPTTQLAATVKLFIDQADFDAYNTARGSYPSLPTSGDINDPYLSNLCITAFHGTPSGGYDPSNYSGTHEFIPNSAITKAWNAAANRWEFSFTISSFSGFFFAAGNQALEIHMGELALSTRNNRHSLSWNTYTEASNDRFEIERSADGKAFTTVQKIACTGKAGAYVFTDAATPAGISYYRLKMISGASGKGIYSNVVSGRATDAVVADVVSTFPNPAKGVLNIHVNGLSEVAGTLTLSDAAGKALKNVITTGSAVKMDISDVPAGFYFLSYRQDGMTQTIKVTVE